MAESDSDRAAEPAASDVIVWGSGVDGGKYRVRVQRVTGSKPPGYAGELVITRIDTSSETVLHRQLVSLTHGAIFGPDMLDVAEWQAIGIEIIDADIATNGAPIGRDSD